MGVSNEENWKFEPRFEASCAKLYTKSSSPSSFSSIGLMLDLFSRKGLRLSYNVFGDWDCENDYFSLNSAIMCASTVALYD